MNFIIRGMYLSKAVKTVFYFQCLPKSLQTRFLSIKDIVLLTALPWMILFQTFLKFCVIPDGKRFTVSVMKL